MPCWGIAKSDSESNPFDADPTPKRGFAVDSAFSWSLDEYVDQGNYERRSVALIKEVSALALPNVEVYRDMEYPCGMAMPKSYLYTCGWIQKRDITSSCTYHTVVSPLQSLELLGVVFAEQCHVYINCHG